MTQDSAPSPELIVISGPNGAGKSTTAPLLLRDSLQIFEFVNADTIAQGLSGFSPGATAIAAGRIMLERLNELASAKRSFAFETTLSGHVYARLIPEWRSEGYRVKLIFLSLPNPEIAIARVAARVAQGGHDVSSAVVRRRFDSGLRNFQHIYKDLVDKWEWYDNSGTTPKLISGRVNPR